MVKGDICFLLGIKVLIKFVFHNIQCLDSIFVGPYKKLVILFSVNLFLGTFIICCKSAFPPIVLNNLVCLVLYYIFLIIFSHCMPLKLCNVRQARLKLISQLMDNKNTGEKEIFMAAHKAATGTDVEAFFTAIDEVFQCVGIMLPKKKDNKKER